MGLKKRKFIFIDDSGDPGYRGTSSRFFLMTALVFDKIDIMSSVDYKISEIRTSLGWSERAEFKFRKTNKLIIKQLLKEVSHFSFAIYSVYIDKVKYPMLMPLIDKGKIYNWLISELLKIIPFEEARVMIDGSANKETRLRTASYVRHTINKDEKRIKSLKLVDSRRDNLIQLADLLSGSLGRSLKNDKTDTDNYISIIKQKIVQFKQIPLNPDI